MKNKCIDYYRSVVYIGLSFVLQVIICIGNVDGILRMQ